MTISMPRKKRRDAPDEVLRHVQGAAALPARKPAARAYPAASISPAGSTIRRSAPSKLNKTATRSAAGVSA
jgi:hypothetical protein